MKYIYITFIAFSLSSCQFLKLNNFVKNQKITLKQSKTPFELINNRIVLKDNVNFLLDIGAPNIIYANNVSQYKILDSVKIGKLINSTGKKVENKSFVIENIDNNFFNIDNAVFRILPDKSFCMNEIGLIGCELFYDEIIMIDFENQIIRKLNNYTQEENQYRELEVTDFDGYYFFIKIPINGENISAKLDTGNPYDLLLKKKDFNKIKKEIYYSYFDKKGEIDTIYNTIAEFSNMKNSFVIKSNNYIKRNLLGVGFMKNYNWIIDYKKGKVFYEKINNSEIKIYKNRTIIKNNNLIFYQTDNQSNIMDLGKTIISVNNQEINSKNICSFKNQLNTNNEWDNLQIKYK